MRRIVLMLICLCAVVLDANAESTICQQRHCLAVVDAGSSGSRLHIYAYDLDSNNTPMQIEEIWSKKIRPGLATIELTTEAMDKYLDQLFSLVPYQNISVYFYATAGMRLLPPPKQQRYYGLLQQWFASQSQWQLIEAKTITGSEEGLFDWLAVNYELGGFSSVDNPLASVMDMGGASVQIAFPVQNSEGMDPHDLISVDISGRHLTLFIHSFLGLGQNVLSQQFLDTEGCFATGYQLPSGLQGSGDALTCQHDIFKLINNVHEVSRITKPALAKSTATSWYALGGVAFMADEKPFAFNDKQFTNQDLLQQGDTEICHHRWDDLYSQYPTNEYLYGYCLFPAYYYALMVDGYGIPPEQPIHYMSSGQGADWSLGVVLHHH